jgi:hypothetical protein
LIAAAAAHFASETAHQGLEGAQVANSTIAINFREMLVSLWHEYYMWWFLTFVGLGVVRLLFILMVNHQKGIDTLK